MHLRILSVALTAVAGVALGAPAANAVGESWGAVMVGPYGAYGWSTEHDTEWAAEQAAQSYCQGECTQGFTFYDTCGAIAVGGDTAFWGAGFLQEMAEEEALSSCGEQYGYDCEIQVWACSF